MNVLPITRKCNDLSVQRNYISFTPKYLIYTKWVITAAGDEGTKRTEHTPDVPSPQGRFMVTMKVKFMR